MAVTRKHASMIAYDERFYDAFARKPWNCQDEHYVSTMLPLLDAHGIEERTLTYVVRTHAYVVLVSESTSVGVSSAR